MRELKRIEVKDLIFVNMPLKDRINTKLTLLDTDWMTYTLETSFHVKTQGKLKIRFEYYGVQKSDLYVTQEKNGICHEYTYSFPSEIFEKYLSKCMYRHLKQWKSEEVFYGGDIAVEFYNEVIELTGKQKSCS